MDLPRKFPPASPRIFKWSRCASSLPLIGQQAGPWLGNTRRGDRRKFFLHLNLLSISFDYWQNINKKGFKKTPTYNMYMRCLQSPVACRSMNMKVHQTLVLLNLLSFGTKDIAALTIGIQSVANHFHKNVQCSSAQSPVACRSMNMKVHQTLVWLNLLSFGTKT